MCARARIAEYNPSLAFLLVATPFQDLFHLGPVIVGQGQSEYIQALLANLCIQLPVSTMTFDAFHRLV